jgi:sugar phosphate isomerase/epimerase
MIADAGLRAPSGHFNYKGLEGKLNYAKELGVHYVICPMLPKSMWASADGFMRAGEQFNKWGEQAGGMGMKFGFHNHNYEFQKFGNSTGFELLMGHTDPKLVCWEMDCYWITQAGLDPVEMLKKYRNRIRMLHLKDRQAGFPTSQWLDKSAEHFAEVGNGTLNWESILAQASEQGIDHYFVEQDESANPMQSIRISYQNLRNILP